MADPTVSNVSPLVGAGGGIGRSHETASSSPGVGSKGGIRAATGGDAAPAMGDSPPVGKHSDIASWGGLGSAAGGCVTVSTGEHWSGASHKRHAAPQRAFAWNRPPLPHTK